VTIAACYVSREGVVLGSDSTSTFELEEKASRHFDFAQKLFEFGESPSTMGAVTWGLGRPGEKSWRTLIAETADYWTLTKPSSFDEAASIAASMFWADYQHCYAEKLRQARELAAKGENVSSEDRTVLQDLNASFAGGFCIGGRWKPEREPCAYAIEFEPALISVPQPQRLRIAKGYFWGCPNLIQRILYGIDLGLLNEICSSGKWAGIDEELIRLISEKYMNSPPFELPLREAIDWVFSSIYTTIKGMKFSGHQTFCGGPIELAVISSDRPFRWVCHKTMGAAVFALSSEQKGSRE